MRDPSVVHYKLLPPAGPIIPKPRKVQELGRGNADFGISKQIEKKS